MGPPTSREANGGGRGRGAGTRGRGGQASFSGRGSGGRGSGGSGNGAAKPFSVGGHKRPAPPSSALPAGTEVTAPYSKKPRKNEDLIKEITASWEHMRRHDVPAAEKTRISEDVLAKVKGSVSKLAMSHTTSRVLQAAAKAAGPKARADTLSEVSPDLLALAKSSYGHFLAAKLISLAPKEEVTALVKRFRGHVASLLRHPTGAAVVDELYARASQRDRDAMTAELYSKEYAVFALSGGGGSGGLTSSSSPIPSALSGALAARGGDARARREMLSRVAALLTPLLEKAMVDPPIVHRVLADFLECATEAASHEVASLLCGGGATLLRVVHTRDGARAACRALASVGAKERKAAVKAMKGHARAMAKDEWGHAVLSTALTVVDDTALLSKTVVSELAASGGEGEGDELAELCSHPHASRVFCQLLSPCDSKVLPPHTLALVKAASDRALGEDGMGAGGGGEGGTKGDENGGDDDDGDNAATTRTASEAATAAQSASKSNLTSKKSASKRRREILGSGSSPTSLGSALLSTLAANAAALLRTPAGGDLVVEAARGGGKDAILLPAHAEGVARLHEAIASAIEESSSAGGGGKKKEKKSREEREKCGKEEEECLLTHFYASRALRRLVLCGGDTASAFSSLLWKRALRGNCAQISGSHAAKVVAAIVVAGGKDIKKEAESELKGCVAGGDVAKWAAGVLKPPPAKK